MLLLVTDTSGKNGSVALARVEEGAPSPGVIASVPLAGGTFSAQLVPQIAELLAAHGFRKSQLDAFVVVSGPGSFTGLRVGLAAIKALAEVLNKPIVPVSLLEVAVVSSNQHGTITAVLDAGRGEVYVGEYEVRDSISHLIREQLLSKDELSSAIGNALVVTHEAVAPAADSSRPMLKVVIDSASVAKVGWQKLQAGQIVSPEQLDANYIRRSDAEIFAKPCASMTASLTTIPKITIRTATAADIPALIVLERQACSAAHWSEEQYRSFFSEHQRRLVLLGHLVGNNSLVGFLVAHQIAMDWELENIVVTAAEQRKGLGAQLLGALISKARGSNGKAVFLEVRASNSAARAIYEKAGFLETGMRKSYYQNPLEDAILYRLDLDEIDVP